MLNVLHMVLSLVTGYQSRVTVSLMLLANPFPLGLGSVIYAVRMRKPPEA